MSLVGQEFRRLDSLRYIARKNECIRTTQAGPLTLRKPAACATDN